MMYWLIDITKLIGGLSIIAVNAFAIYVTLRHHKRASNSHLFMCNIWVANTLIGLLTVVPQMAHSTTETQTHFTDAVQPVNFMIIFTTFISLFAIELVNAHECMEKECLPSPQSARRLTRQITINTPDQRNSPILCTRISCITWTGGGVYTIVKWLLNWTLCAGVAVTGSDIVDNNSSTHKREQSCDNTSSMCVVMFEATLLIVLALTALILCAVCTIRRVYCYCCCHRAMESTVAHALCLGVVLAAFACHTARQLHAVDIRVIVSTTREQPQLDHMLYMAALAYTYVTPPLYSALQWRIVARWRREAYNKATTTVVPTLYTSPAAPPPVYRTYEDLVYATTHASSHSAYSDDDYPLHRQSIVMV